MTAQSFWQFILEQQDKLLTQIGQHLGLTFLSLVFAILIGVPLGVLISRKRKFAAIILGFAGVLQTVPSIALLGFLIPVLGIGAIPAIVALFIYALLPIIRNSFTGITGVGSSIVEAAKAMGMTDWQLLLKVELPLAMPVIIAGVRTAAVINVGVATLASFVAAGGLGEFIFGGISLNNSNMILAGAIPAALLAILLDKGIALIQYSLVNIKSRQTYIILGIFTAMCFLSMLYMAMRSNDSRIKAGFTPEFMGRQDGDLGLRSIYDLQVNPLVVSDAIMYKAAYEKDLDLISGYSTDGRIKAYDLFVLADDKKIFPPYFASPIIKTATLQKFPKLEETMNLLADKFNDSVMTELNYKADFLKQTPEHIAKDFLLHNNLYKPTGSGSAGTIKVGSKIFAEQYILAAIYKILIEGHTDYKVDTKTGLGGTKICFDALMSDAIDCYVEYTGTGLLVLLKPNQQVLGSVSKSPSDTYNYVNNEFQKLYGIKWLKPLGFNNAYALIMRRSQARELHIERISDLKKYY
ncbi:ABC transporter permease/substrate-binding protein [Sphingobacterium multivorum]|uniref:Osmoprotectant uptake system permease protein yehW n=1 Tax=Sphingobacterium multivorum TaxID=28454 RepID=A0A654DIE6_SPHMU|nr:ABC transporter permease/substrate-binding protein [Sphingobacterium multivorum]VXD04228.1 Osmoprotectant uptake system permease protein yehW [Sphingobacterium multivorum]